jgi:uncharacterized membrane protein YoaT (DUF817 family)
MKLLLQDNCKGGSWILKEVRWHHLKTHQLSLKKRYSNVKKITILLLFARCKHFGECYHNKFQKNMLSSFVFISFMVEWKLEENWNISKTQKQFQQNLDAWRLILFWFSTKNILNGRRLVVKGLDVLNIKGGAFPSHKKANL